MAAFTLEQLGKQFFSTVRRCVPREHRDDLIAKVLVEGAAVDIGDIPFRKVEHFDLVQAELDRLAGL